MKCSIFAVTALGLLALGACQKADEKPSLAANGPRGRYVGVGIYSPGQMWAELAQPATPAAEPAAATLDDDEQVIVVLDSATGDVRQCGNLSGHCIGLNPWAKPLAAGQGLPVSVQKHAQQLVTEIHAQSVPASKSR